MLIVGQGLAGTALGLELERAGVPFAIASDGHARAASMAAAGLVNPVQGQRFVKVWRVEELRPFAEDWYRGVEAELGVTLWHPLRLRRLFANATEAARAARKLASGELAPFARAADGGVEIHGAAWVDLPALLTRAAERWRARGVLCAAAVTHAEVQADATGVVWRGERFAAAVLCTGRGVLAREFFPELPFEAAKGEILHVGGSELPVGHAVSRGTWAIADAPGRARVGATYEPGVEDEAASATARASLLASARAFVPGNLTVIEQRAGVRVSLPDRLPAAGWRHDARIGLFGALGSKGTLFAPWLARRWREALGGATNAWPDAVSVARSHASGGR
ncbi:NAD(P)/FAD-dependent oxidoreductase [Oleiharenicola sp. Vm1]|uniref:NAD(P)/FAD-dependent oxidoreductase n=1 Tax=Oleiharenicola sp. Vm1 TaxID=3398393 RepID=UPI0039F548F5